MSSDQGHSNNIHHVQSDAQHMQAAETPQHTQPGEPPKSSLEASGENFRKEFEKANKVAGVYAAVMQTPNAPEFGAIGIQVYPGRKFFARKGIVHSFGDSIRKEFNLGDRDKIGEKIYDYAVRKKILSEPPLFWSFKNVAEDETGYIDIRAPADELWGLYAVDLSKTPDHTMYAQPGWCYGFSEGVKIDFSYLENYFTATHFMTKVNPLWEKFSGDGIVLLRAPTSLRVIDLGKKPDPEKENEKDILHPIKGQKLDRDDIFAFTTKKLGVKLTVDPGTLNGAWTNVLQLWNNEPSLSVYTEGPGQVVESRGIAKIPPPVDKEKEEQELLKRLEERQAARQPPQP